MKHLIHALTPFGLEAELVEVEVDQYAGLPGTVIVGLGDTAVQESKERVKAALKNSGYRYPRGKVVINLAPADIRKTGPYFDMAIAVSLMSCSYELRLEEHSKAVFLGELALDGSFRPLPGILSLTYQAKQRGFEKIFVPRANASEASLVEGISVFAVASLTELGDFLLDSKPLKPFDEGRESQHEDSLSPEVEMATIVGQTHAKRALEIAAAGGHNLLLNGPPGAGKTLMAQALRGILPRLSKEESLQVSQLHSLVGLLHRSDPLVRQRPYRRVHHTASGTSLVGGGRVPLPGEISLAHRGVLFLDEVAEFPQRTLDLLRQPLEDGEITIARTQRTLTYPARFILCAAMNPCPCGYAGSRGERQCRCTPALQRRYQKRLSGPFLDRIDLYCSVPALTPDEMRTKDRSETSLSIRERVEQARSIQEQRFRKRSFSSNAEMSHDFIQQSLVLKRSAGEVLSQAQSRYSFSMRKYMKILKLSRTIADLEQHEEIDEEHVLEALQYRCPLA